MTGTVGATLTAAALAAQLLGACGREAPTNEAQSESAPDPAAQSATPSSDTVDAAVGSDGTGQTTGTDEGDAMSEPSDDGDAMSEGTGDSTVDGTGTAGTGDGETAAATATVVTAPVLTADSVVGVVDPTPGMAGVKITSQGPIVAPTPTTTPPAAADTVPPGTGGVHVVESGETLSGIAATYGVSVQAIADANDLADVDTLKLGQELQIPAG